MSVAVEGGGVIIPIAWLRHAFRFYEILRRRRRTLHEDIPYRRIPAMISLALPQDINPDPVSTLRQVYENFHI